MTIDLESSLDPGNLGVLHLKRLWSRSLRERLGIGNISDAREWQLDNVIYHGLNLPIEETIQFLYQIAPSFDEFESWVVARNNGVLHRNAIERVNASIASLLNGEPPDRGHNSQTRPILTEADLESWKENGYLVVSDLFSADVIADAERAIWDHLEMRPDDPDTWYERRRDHGIMIQFFHHPALDAIRRSPELRRVFADIWGTADLLISTDRVSFNPPERAGYNFPGPHLHWDVSLELPIPLGVQGLVYLTDTAADQGAFTCVPGFHTKIGSWLESLPPNADPRNVILDSPDAVPIPGNAGDVIIWHQALPHGSSPNRVQRPRIVQYVTMFPADANYSKHWI